MQPIIRRALILAILCMAPTSGWAQTLLIQTPAGGVILPPVWVIPASAVNGAGKINVPLVFANGTTLQDDAIDVLALRRGVNTQQFNVYRTYTDGSNNAGMALYGTFSGTSPGIIPFAAGTGGTAADLHLSSLGATGQLKFWTNGTNVWNISGAGNIADQGSHTITAGSTITTTAGYLAGNGFGYLSNSGTGIMFRESADGVARLRNDAGTGFTRLILGTNDGTSNGIALKQNAGVLETWTGDGSGARVSIYAAGLGAGATPGANGTLNLGAKVTQYNSINTAGWGAPAVYGQATTGTVTNTGTASIATYTNGAADGVFHVSCDVSITVSTTHSFSCDVTYTDVTNAARTMVLPMNGLAGTFLTSGLMTNVTGVGPYESATVQIRAKASTAITVRTSAGGTFTTVTYTASGSILQIG